MIKEKYSLPWIIRLCEIFLIFEKFNWQSALGKKCFLFWKVNGLKLFAFSKWFKSLEIRTPHDPEVLNREKQKYSYLKKKNNAHEHGEYFWKLLEKYFYWF